jgi:hypothetical protein
MLRTISTGALMLVIAAAVAAQTPATPQQPANETAPRPAAGGILGRPSPPQPVQKQGVEYFVGTWTFKWTGRESAVSPGPRTGTVTFTRRGDSPILEFQTSGEVEGLGTYQESGTWEWQPAQKSMVMKDRLAGGVEAASLGDWSSPISIRAESEPIRLPNQTLKLRRTYGIVSATSYTTSDELSIDGKPFVRLGGGVFTKAVK